MARPKKEKPIIVNGLDDSFVVEKSRPLMLMKEVPFELGELKVLDTYLSRINAREADATTVRFSKEEYEDLMGIERMRPERLEKYVKSIMSKTVTIPDAKARGGWRVYTLFDEAECYQDENDQWWIDLSCTTKARKLFFNIDKIGYIRYQLKNVLPLTSKYSVLLYIYLLDNRFRREWDVPVTELREKIFRNNSEYYEDYKYFKRDILDKSLKEVNAKTDLTFEYSPVKAGRKVTAIHWKLIKDEVLLPLEQDPNQTTIDDFLPEPETKKDPNAMFASVLPPELTPDQVETLRVLAVDHYSKHLYHPSDTLTDRDLKIYDYLKSKMLVMQAQTKPVKSKFAWLKKAVAGDWHV